MKNPQVQNQDQNIVNDANRIIEMYDTNAYFVYALMSVTSGMFVLLLAVL